MAGAGTDDMSDHSSHLKEKPQCDMEVECPICYQTCVHPVRLPCQHVFCFLCAKGIIQRTRRCAMCRQSVDPSYLENPELLDTTHLKAAEDKDKILWFYQARSQGWWLYEKRIATEIEDRYQQNKHCFDIQIAGYIYTIDLHEMVQYRKDNSGIRRAIKRDLIRHVTDVKGNAGLRLSESSANSGGDSGDGSTKKADNIVDMVSELTISRDGDDTDTSSDLEILV